MRRVIFFILFSFVLSATRLCAADAEDFFAEKRKKMVEGQIAARGVKDNRVINAMLKVPRHLFVPDNLRNIAYGDTPLPIGYGQTISQPYIVAFMTEALNLEKEDRVLEIGTGSGYQAAILAEIAKEVYTIEIVPPLAGEAKRRLGRMGYRNITVKCGDGYSGWGEKAPFDGIIVTAAPREIPQRLVEQLKIGGRMVVPVGVSFQELYLVTKTKDGVREKRLIPVRFVPMVHGE